MFASLCSQYLHTCAVIFSEQLSAGNPPGKLTDSSHDLAFGKHYRWSDFNVSIPALYCFTHGLELYLKAYLEGKKATDGHRLSVLFKDLVEVYGGRMHFLRIPRKYIEANSNALIDEVLRRGLNRGYRALPTIQNKKSCGATTKAKEIDLLYEILRYPHSTAKKKLGDFPLITSHFLKDSITHSGGMYEEQINEIVSDCNAMRLNLIKLRSDKLA